MYLAIEIVAMVSAYAVMQPCRFVQQLQVGPALLYIHTGASPLFGVKRLSSYQERKQTGNHVSLVASSCFTLPMPAVPAASAHNTPKPPSSPLWPRPSSSH